MPTTGLWYGSAHRADVAISIQIPIARADSRGRHGFGVEGGALRAGVTCRHQAAQWFDPRRARARAFSPRGAPGGRLTAPQHRARVRLRPRKKLRLPGDGAPRRRRPEATSDDANADGRGRLTAGRTVL